jgi:hypothetical protein
MRVARLLLLVTVLTTGCESAVAENESVEFTLRLQLKQGYDVGPTPGRVYVYIDTIDVPRALAFPENGEACVLATTPVTTCTYTVPFGSFVSLVAAEPDPAVFVRFGPESPQDTVRDGRYVEFTGWTDCDERAERGVCVVRPTGNMTVEGSFQLLQQILVYQTGAAHVDWLAFVKGPSLKVPAVNDNILDYAGCQRLRFSLEIACDSVHAVGDSRHHRISAFIGRQTIFGMFTKPGLETEVQGWEGPCIVSGIYGPGVCSLITPEEAGPPIRITVHYSWWDCPRGPSDRDSGFCALKY